MQLRREEHVALVEIRHTWGLLFLLLTLKRLVVLRLSALGAAAYVSNSVRSSRADIHVHV